MNSIWQAFRVEWRGEAAEEIGRVLVHSLWQGAIRRGRTGGDVIPSS